MLWKYSFVVGTASQYIIITINCSEEKFVCPKSFLAKNVYKKWHWLSNFSYKVILDKKKDQPLNKLKEKFRLSECKTQPRLK